jgi:hypothetical protein
MSTAVSVDPLGGDDDRAAAFWSASPRWAADAARVEVDGELVVWHDTAQFALGPAASALAVHFDGSLPLDVLVTDLVEAVGLPDADARALVASVVVDLASVGVIEGVELPPSETAPPAEASGGRTLETSDSPGSPSDSGREDDPSASPSPPTAHGAVASAVPAGPPPDAGEPTSGDQGDSDPPSDASEPEVLRVETSVDANGNQVVVEHLSGGRRRMSTKIDLMPREGPSATLLQAALAAERSPAELVPVDSCLGSKLRNHDDVPLVPIRCSDGRVRSVRCHDLAVLDLLYERFGAAVAAGEQGPITAFVVTPLEGDGPRRVFDGMGQRRGRPRSAEETVDLVDQILGEVVLITTGWHPNEPLALDLVALSHQGGASALVPLGALGDRGVARSLRGSGWRLRWTEVALDGKGRAVIAAANAASPQRLEDPVVVMGPPGLTSAQRVRLLLRPVIVPAEDRPQLIGRLAAFAQAATWAPFDRPLPEVLDDVVR